MATADEQFAYSINAVVHCNQMEEDFAKHEKCEKTKNSSRRAEIEKLKADVEIPTAQLVSFITASQQKFIAVNDHKFIVLKVTRSLPPIKGELLAGIYTAFASQSGRDVQPEEVERFVAFADKCQIDNKKETVSLAFRKTRPPTLLYAT